MLTFSCTVRSSHNKKAFNPKIVNYYTLYVAWYQYNNIHLFLKRTEISTKNTLAVKKLQPRPEKGCDEKYVKSKRGGQKMFYGLDHHYQNF